jgi:dUTP pyrophosphatase
MNKKHLLKIKVSDDCPNRQTVVDYYTKKAADINYASDSGIDIIFPQDVTIDVNTVSIIDMGIKCEFIPNYNTNANISSISGPFLLSPRSSISNTPVMMANTEGKIDAHYRGNIKCAVRCFKDIRFESTYQSKKYTIAANTRLFQILSPDMQPIEITVVTTLSETDRGSNGFGSTGIIG